LQQAKEALEIKRHERREDSLPVLGRKPIFGDYCYTYFEKTKVQRKRPGTVKNERQAIARWRSHLGHLRIDKIATPMIAAFVDKRLKGGAFGGHKLEPVSERTANLDLMALRNMLKSAIDDGYLRDLPKIKMLERIRINCHRRFIYIVIHAMSRHACSDSARKCSNVEFSLSVSLATCGICLSLRHWMKFVVKKLFPTPPLPLMTRLICLLIGRCVDSEVAGVCDTRTADAGTPGRFFAVLHRDRCL